MSILRLVALFAMVAVASAFMLQADALTLRLRGDQLFVSTQRIDMFRGPLLKRLKNGSSVAYDFHLALWVGNRNSVRRRAFERFVVSYDLWEEKFAVTNIRKPRSSAGGLTPKEVEAWCLEKISLPAVNLRGESTVWAKLEVRSADPKQDEGMLNAGGVSITDLVELLSRPARKDEQRWAFESGAVKVPDLMREAEQK